MPDRRSPFHGLNDAVHGPHEHGLGANASPPDPRDFPIEQLAGVTAGVTYAASWVEPNSPPVLNQGTTPQCVAYSSAADQAHEDRPELGKYVDFDESRFFSLIGGTAQGAVMRNALDRRLHYGYPVAGLSLGSELVHRIKAYYSVPLGSDALKSALLISPANGGVLVIGPWYHSWFHPFSSGKLPIPDYVVGGHAWWARGWNDSYGLRGRNSWGAGWGAAGDFYLPYSYLGRMYEAWRTVDA